ncbi:MarR family transcriptional regulator [Bradyrhizobium sp. WSM 1704]|uniref:MarR family winged helix-turn-helix transcriptional regulator n=1 Tax=Bradyrhizobium semiaridum TaxID=2821404 RepID=UPI001CE333D2|nr:MarR family transcriptional regulator [Bradyrhizobium semiaridum]MCA6123678.1 MarR family transcriptional regulator [Bradyrhizobium semiaridum]
MRPPAPVPDDDLKLSAWLPYRLFLVAAQIARPLEDFYGETFGLSQAGWRILAVIAERNGANASEIGRACALDPFAVSRGIGQLVELGFAVRRPGRIDRRYAAVSITRSGRAAFNRIAALGRTIETRLLARLADAERAMLDSAVGKLEAESARIGAGGWRSLLEDDGSS